MEVVYKLSNKINSYVHNILARIKEHLFNPKIFAQLPCQMTSLNSALEIAGLVITFIIVCLDNCGFQCLVSVGGYIMI